MKNTKPLLLMHFAYAALSIRCRYFNQFDVTSSHWMSSDFGGNTEAGTDVSLYN